MALLEYTEGPTLLLEHTTRSRRMMESLPSYYHGNELIERAILAIAGELDRLEAEAEAVRDGLIAGQSGNLGLLAAWEFLLGLPVNPPAATVPQRLAKIRARFQALDTARADAFLEALRTAAGVAQIKVYENTPGLLSDTLEIAFDPGTYNAAQVEAIARIMWPAHRGLEMRYSAGFILDASRLDADSL